MNLFILLVTSQIQCIIITIIYCKITYFLPDTVGTPKFARPFLSVFTGTGGGVSCKTHNKLTDLWQWNNTMSPTYTSHWFSNVKSKL